MRVKEYLQQNKKELAERFFPFLRWLPELKNPSVLKADLIAALTVVMLLIPQSMAYAKLAGLPVYYGLYAAFIPPIVAVLFGSSRILSTGPVAITSLMTATALQPLVASGAVEYPIYVVLLTLMSGLIQFILGVFRLGVVLNFVSYPVLLGFTNAAAIIIATAQLGSFFGVPSLVFSHHYQTVWQVLSDAFAAPHLPTLAIGSIAIGIIIVCRKFWPRLPNVLIAVFITMGLAWLFGYEKSKTINAENIVNHPVREMLISYQQYPKDFARLNRQIDKSIKNLAFHLKESGKTTQATAEAMDQLSSAKWELERRMILHNVETIQLNQLRLQELVTEKNQTMYFSADQITPIGKVSTVPWRISQLNANGTLTIQAGGKIVGELPKGLPAFQIPGINLELLSRLFLAALAIALIGFMEAATITRYLATNSREIPNVNQELIGQGLAKLAGSFFQSMPVSGAFSRTAVNFEAGAKTGFSSVFAGLIVMIVLLWLTPLFYYLPEATLAVVIIISALGLINFKALAMVYKIHKREGIVAFATFVLTLILAPKLEYAILLGVLLSLGVHLNESRKPRFMEMIRDEMGDFRDVTPDENTCYLISLVRFGGSLYFANTAYFESQIIKLVANKPKLRYIILDCGNINKIDASGLEILRSLSERLQEAGLELWFTKLRQSVLHFLKKGGLYEFLGEHHFYKSNDSALALLSDYLGAKHMSNCPLAKKPLKKPS